MQAQASVRVIAGQMRRVPVIGLEAKLLRSRVWWVRTCALSNAACRCMCVMGMRGTRERAAARCNLEHGVRCPDRGGKRCSPSAADAIMRAVVAARCMRETGQCPRQQIYWRATQQWRAWLKTITYHAALSRGVAHAGARSVAGRTSVSITAAFRRKTVFADMAPAMSKAASI